MVLEGDTSNITAPGQFINIELAGKFLRRPISICDWNETTITIIYKVVGEGTRQMAGMKEGEELDILVGLGNGFNTNIDKMKHPLLVGGGVGVPPMYGLAKKLLAEGKRPTMIMGFNTAEAQKRLYATILQAVPPLPIFTAVQTLAVTVVLDAATAPRYALPMLSA